MLAMHSPRRLLPPAAVLVASLVVLAAFASAGRVDTMAERLPAPVSMTCAVYTGSVVYVFGGATEGDILDTIWSIDPETGETTVLPFTLPSPRKLASAVWTGSVAYVIGGIGFDAEPMAEMVRFEPGVGVEVVEGAIPYGIKGVPSVWSGEAVYVLGNCLSSEVGHHDVVRYYPSNGTTQVLDDVLPIPGAGSSATWVDDAAIIVGGRQNLTVLSNRFIRYVPDQGAELMRSVLPQGRIGAACAWSGDLVYVLGGTIALECGPLECVPVDHLDEILCYDPQNDTCWLLRSTLPEPMDLRAALFVEREGEGGDAVLVPGGQTDEGPIDRITLYHTGAASTTPQELPFYRSPVLWMVIIAMVTAALFIFIIDLLVRGGRKGDQTDEELMKGMLGE